jgi:hypothetical protein
MNNSPGVRKPDDRAAALIRSALGVPARLLEGNSIGGEDIVGVASDKLLQEASRNQSSART